MCPRIFRFLLKLASMVTFGGQFSSPLAMGVNVLPECEIREMFYSLVEILKIISISERARTVAQSSLP